MPRKTTSPSSIVSRIARKIMNRLLTLWLLPCLAMADPAEHSHKMHLEMQHESMVHAMSPAECKEDSYWDFSFGMCAPLPMEGKNEWMLHGNAFIAGITQSGPRGRDGIAAPNMLMGDAGSALGNRHYLGINLMLTAEKWAFPEDGYPLLFQIGEEDKNGRPYIDGQHPHSSPIMGLTLSDTIRLGEGRDHLKIFFAPRGQATEGPTAFMHRVTGMMNPDAPLSHHLGQDVSHITSTVLGVSAGLTSTRIETSTYHGEEPEPTKVDLPLGKFDSYAGRLIQELGQHFSVMGSVAYVKRPEHNDPTLDHIWRYSASLYHHHDFGGEWMIHNALIYGLVNFYDHVPSLSSVLDEFWLHPRNGPSNIFGRIELVQRSHSELGITARDPLETHWITALTLGYAHRIAKLGPVEFGVGASGTQYVTPSAFKTTYDGYPMAGRIFVQIRGMRGGTF